jgi:hypothetical protein
MELTNEFEVPVPVEEAWSVLTDIERIAPCLPGAQLQEVEGNEYRGTVKVKVGPITAQYKGRAQFVELDPAARKALLSATGRDTRGQGDASASVTAILTERGDATHVSLVTDLALTGKVAQFGRGVLAEVSTKLLEQFLANLEATVLAAGAAGAAGTAEDVPTGATGTDAEADAVGAEAETADAGVTTPASGEMPPAESPVTGSTVRRIESPEAEPVDLVAAGGAPIVKRLLPLAFGVALLTAAFVLLRRRRRARR